MPKGILGKKLGMTQYFDEKGKALPVTVIQAGPCVIVQKKNEDKDGYKAIQLGFGEIKDSKVKKPLKGHFNKAGVEPKRYLKEIRINGESEMQGDVGDQVSVDIFSEGEKVDVTGKSKGKGFSGVMKRWNFSGGPKTHGSHFKRAPGSLGASADPARVFKGKKLPGRKGGEKVTLSNLEVVRVDPERDLILIKGSVPGAKKSLLTIVSSEVSSE